MKDTLAVLNIIAFIITIAVNYLSNTGLINDATIGDVSGAYNNLFTPAGYAFAIWGIIYLLLLGFVIYQARALTGKQTSVRIVERTGFWFIISCVANSSWVFCWLYGYLLLSLIFMLVLLVSLLQIVLKNEMELWDAPIPVIAFFWWPFVVYAGWITVATVANVAAWLTQIEWSGWGISEISWTMVMIGIATSLNLLVIWKRNMREFALVGAWALFAIGVANSDAQPLITDVANVCGIVLLIAAVIHGMINWRTNPMIKTIEFFRNG